MEKLIGILSDTHGLLREEVIEKLRPCSRIIHAGDVGDRPVLEELQKIAPVTAVRGNTDRGLWAEALGKTEYVEFRGFRIFVLHDIGRLDLDPAAAGVQAVVYGHSHAPSLEYRGQVLFLNPGSAGPRRFGLPVSMAYIRARGNELLPELVEIRAR
ncbi:MAG: metallophosphoesterase family protein [Endomicrobiales bacterium]